MWHYKLWNLSITNWQKLCLQVTEFSKEFYHANTISCQFPHINKENVTRVWKIEYIGKNKKGNIHTHFSFVLLNPYVELHFILNFFLNFFLIVKHEKFLATPFPPLYVLRKFLIVAEWMVHSWGLKCVICIERANKINTFSVSMWQS